MARKLTKRKPPYRPPPKGRLPLVAVRMSPALTARIDAWAEKNEVGRSEALRQLAEKALACEAAQGAEA
jgi:metal-responsive CopG/Arc/MetJ family transcriptional regulator